MTDSAMKPVRRIVTIDDAEGKSLAIADGPSPDRTTDPARPGFVSERIWVTDASPPQISAYRDAVLHQPRRLEPPRGGSVCRIVTFPPDNVFRGKVGAAEVEAFSRRHRLTGGLDLFGESAASLHAENADARFLSCSGRRDRAGARHRRSPPQSRRHRCPARYQSRLEQSLGQSMPNRLFIARRCGCLRRGLISARVQPDILRDPRPIVRRIWLKLIWPP